MTKVCDYYFAPQSPYVYLGHARFVALARKYDAKINLKPIDLGKVFNVSGGLPLAKRPPQRQAYRLLELQRWSEHLRVPLNPEPKFFPVAGDPAAKLIIATQREHGTDAALMLMQGVMRALWAEDKNISDAEQLIAIANASGLEGQSLLTSSDDASVQSEYDRFTQEAIDADVFGVPWFVVDGEAFWGQDRLDFVERAFAR